jgi:hypothetical protein
MVRRLFAGGRWIRTIGTPSNFLPPRSFPAIRLWKKNRLPRDRDRRFESSPSSSESSANLDFSKSGRKRNLKPSSRDTAVFVLGHRFRGLVAIRGTEGCNPPPSSGEPISRSTQFRVANRRTRALLPRVIAPKRLALINRGRIGIALSRWAPRSRSCESQQRHHRRAASPPLVTGPA